MTTATIIPNGKQFYTNNTGTPLVGGKVFTYDAGTTNPRPTFTDASGTVPNTNPVILDARGEAAVFWSGVYKVVLQDSLGNVIWTVDNVSGTNDPNLLPFDPNATYTAGSLGAFVKTLNTSVTAISATQAQYGINVMSAPYNAKGDGVTDDTAAIQAAINALPSRGLLYFPTPSVSYKINGTLNFINKPGCIFAFNNCYFDASGFITTAKPALYFKGIAEAIVGPAFVIGNKTFVSAGFEFDADATYITIYARIGRLHASGCNIGIKVGSTGVYQFSDSTFEQLYGSDSNIGVYLTGQNTLAMQYDRIDAFQNTQYGVLIEAGGGTINYLQGAHNGTNFFFGRVSGLNHNLLNRFDILGGYSEEAIAGEVFIGSTACADTNPFRESITLRNFRVTPFTSTTQINFIQWNLNGDLVLADITITDGAQTPEVLIAGNNTYRKGRIVFERGVFDMDPGGSSVAPIVGSISNPSQIIDFNDVRCNNAITTWQNAGAVNPGVMIRGIDTRKIREFETALLGIPGLVGSWNLRDLISGTCRNIVLGGPDLAINATAQELDQWYDDGLVGFYRYGGNSSKTFSASSAKFAVGPFTFGAILRCGTAGVDETNFTTLGDTIGSGAGLGFRLGIGNTGGAFLRAQIGATTIQVVPDNGYDPHLVVGTYNPATALAVYGINLRTGNVVTGTGGAPATGALTWAQSLSFRNDLCLRGMPFVYNAALTAGQVQQLQQAALRLTESWRLA